MGELLVRGVKEQVIQFLSSQWPLSAKSLYLKVRKQKSCTYQAVHKMLQEMLREGILAKQDNGYALNLDWIKRLKSTSDSLERTYNRQEAIEYPKTYVFNTYMAMGRFIIRRFLRLKNPSNKVSVCRWRHMYSLIGLAKEAVDTLKKSASQTPYYILCCKNSPYDQFLTRTYEDLGGRVLLNVDGVGDPDVFVRGDYIIEVYPPKELKEEWDYVHNTYSTPAFDFKRVTDLLHERKGHITVSIHRDPVLADQLRMETLKLFTENSLSSLIPIQSAEDHTNEMFRMFRTSPFWKELSHDTGLAYTFFSENEEEYTRFIRVIQQNESNLSPDNVCIYAVPLHHYKAIFDYFREHRVQWMVQHHSLRWHYQTIKKALGEKEAHRLLQNPEINKSKYGVETRILKRNLPFTLGAFEKGMWVMYPREKRVVGFASREEKMIASFTQLFDDYWNESEPYNWKKILTEFEREQLPLKLSIRKKAGTLESIP